MDIILKRNIITTLPLGQGEWVYGYLNDRLVQAYPSRKHAIEDLRQRPQPGELALV